MSLQRSLKLWLWYSYYGTLDLLRQPVYTVPTVIFPATFFWFFGVPEALSADIANFLVGSFSAFAVFGVVFLQFGVGMAEERGHPWYEYLKTKPAPKWIFFASRMVSALFFSLSASALVFLVGWIETPSTLSLIDAFRVFAGLLCFGIPFVLMGCTLGLLVSARAALPIANLIYLPLSFAGGMWKPPALLPESLKTISAYLPTRSYVEIIWSLCLDQSLPKEEAAKLAAFGFIFLITTALALKFGPKASNN